MKTALKLTEEQSAALLGLLQLGHLRYRDIAARFNIAPSYVSTIARRAGIVRNCTLALSAEMQTRASQMLKLGHSISETARTLSCPYHRIKSVSNQLALSGDVEVRPRLTELEERSIRTDLREFEQQQAVKYGCSLSAIQKIVRRRQ
jgi:hypothetical protein